MISVLIITKNDGEVIADAIKSVKDLADEIVVIDGGSSDETIETAEKLGVKVVKNPFKNFSDQRSLAASVAKNEWIFYLDSDERATPEFIREVKLKTENVSNSVAGFYIRRKTFYLGKNWGFSDRVERIFLKDKLKGWHGVVHETPEVDGVIETINEPIFHYTHRNLEQMVNKTNDWSEYEAELRAKANHPKMNAFRFLRVMMTAFIRSFIFEKGYGNGTAGLIESIFQAFSMFVTYAKLWEKQQKNR